MVADKSRFARPNPPFAAAKPAGVGRARDPARQHDALLVARFLAGDGQAFEEIVVRHRPRIFAIAFARLHSRSDAEEIVQDTFLRAHRGLARFRGEASLATWLHRVTVNLTSNRYWYFFRRGQHMAQSIDQPLRGDDTSSLADTVASDVPGPVREAMTNEFMQIAADHMERLNADQREILRLRVVLDRSYSEIAGTLGLNVGTVKSRIARARERLQARMAEAFPDFAAAALPAEWLGSARSDAG